MSDVSSGPVSTMPGHRQGSPSGVACDHDGCLRDATVRVQGETDSFGAEYLDFCEQHVPKREVYGGQCDWCKKDAEVLRATRDSDEGMCGPVYQVCTPCRTKQEDELRKELERDY